MWDEARRAVFELDLAAVIDAFSKRDRSPFSSDGYAFEPLADLRSILNGSAQSDDLNSRVYFQ